jgi:signal transduction histidine kinase
VCFQVEGDERVVEVSVERLGRRGLWVATVTDVTERVRQEFELAEARRHLAQEERLRTIGAVSSGIAHDLNNALNAIGISLYQLAETTDERKRADKIQRLSRSVNDAADRIHRLQDIVKQRTGYESALFDLAEVIEEAAELARAEFTQASPFRRHAHHVRTTLKASTLIRADRSEMKHVFLNLILNARDAMPDGGNVSVTTRDEDGNTVVEVADEGTGISEEQLAKIFEPFFTTKGIEGTGLGLSMARSAMNRIGGRISAANRPSGGAVFTLVFPPHCATDDHSPSHEFSPAIAGRDNNSGEQNALSGSAPESSCISKLRVLIVDDDPDCLSGMREMLQRRGCEVDIASSGNAAIRKVKAGKTYDLVLCDIWMPDLNGWDVAKRITECTPEARICLFTGQSALRPANSTQGNIIADVLTKPVLPEQLDRFLSRN